MDFYALFSGVFLAGYVLGIVTMQLLNERRGRPAVARAGRGFLARWRGFRGLDRRWGEREGRGMAGKVIGGVR